MKHICFLFTALIATTALWASNVITYTASKKLAEKEKGEFIFGGAIHVDAFNVAISSHTFSNGEGTITFDGEVTTIGEEAFYQCNFTSITIPNSVDSIGNDAFAGCDSLESVTFPDSITIGAWAFLECNSLRTINFGNRANRIGWSAFSDCDSLSTLTITSGVTRIDSYAFSYCPSLRSVYWNVKKCDTGFTIFNGSQQIESFVFGDSVQEIPKSLCSQLENLTSITISKSVTKIGASAFSRCTNLTSIIIPENVSEIGDYAFEFCTRVPSITVSNDVSQVGTKAFYGVKNLFYHGSLTAAPWGACCLNGTLEGYLIYSDTTKKKLCSCLTTAIGAIDIPKTVDTIAYCTFTNCGSIDSITIPNNISYIGSSAFEGCTGLKSVTIPNSVTYIGSYAFSGCTSLQSASLPQYLKSIRAYTFSDCKSLTDISLPNSVKNVGVSAFSGCTSLPVEDNIRYADTYLVEAVNKSLSTYTIREGTKWIGSSAFSDCSSLLSISIPNSVTSIGRSAFNWCTSLKSITIPNSVKSIEFGAFYYCWSLPSITIPSSVTSIGERAFALCDSLAAITVDRDNTKFSSIDGVLYNYNKDSLIHYPMGNPRTSYTIPNGVTRIGIWSFYKQYDYNCPLQAITIPSSVTHIGQGAFVFCTTLTSITCYAITPPACGERCFAEVDKSIPLYVPEGSIDAYKAADGWSDFTNIQAAKESALESISFPSWESQGKASKFIRDGHLLILRDGKIYNAQGTRL